MAFSAKQLCAASTSPILTAALLTPIGWYHVKVCGQGIHAVQRIPKVEVTTGKFDFSFNIDEPNESAFAVDSNDAENFPAGLHTSIKNLEALAQWFRHYFKNPGMMSGADACEIQICVPGATEFQLSVWNALKDKVPFGMTLSYKELAALVHKPNAARAVGSAMKKNPNALLVPCHRVIKSTSEIGNYSAVGGSEIKQWLLDHERSKMKEK